MKSTRPALRPAILGFVLTLLVVTGLCTAQFLLKYGPDIFGKDLEASAIFKILSLEILSELEFALPISVLVMTTLHYRSIFKHGPPEIRIRPALLTSFIFALISFLYIAFILPVVHLHEAGLLFDIRGREINAPLERTELSFFKKSLITSNYREINGVIDSTRARALSRKAEYSESIRANQLTGERLKLYAEMMSNETEQADHVINRMQIKKAGMLSYPFIVFILFYAGMFLGILNRRTHLLVLLLSIGLAVFPGIVYLSLYFEKLARSRSVTPLQSQLFYSLIILFITLGLYLYAKRQLGQEVRPEADITN